MIRTWIGPVNYRELPIGVKISITSTKGSRVVIELLKGMGHVPGSRRVKILATPVPPEKFSLALLPCILVVPAEMTHDHFKAGGLVALPALDVGSLIFIAGMGTDDEGAVHYDSINFKVASMRVRGTSVLMTLRILWSCIVGRKGVLAG